MTIPGFDYPALDFGPARICVRQYRKAPKAHVFRMEICFGDHKFKLVTSVGVEEARQAFDPPIDEVVSALRRVYEELSLAGQDLYFAGKDLEGLDENLAVMARPYEDPLSGDVAI